MTRFFSLLLVAALAPAATASAAEVSGPAGVRVERPARTIACPAGAEVATLRVAARFTAASTRRRVRSVRVVVVGTRTAKAIAARRGRAREARIQIPCGREFVLRYEARNARRRVLAQRSFRITSTRTTPGQATPGAPSGDPFASGPPPGAQAQPPGSSTTWTTLVDVRRSGSRAGQVCAQVSSTTADNRRTVVPTYCGKLTEDPFFVRTQEATDADGVRRLILAGVANTDRVSGIAVNGQNLPLSAPRDGQPDTGGAFIALFDPATTRFEDLTLTVTLTDGTTQTHSAPGEINLRAANGSRL